MLEVLADSGGEAPAPATLNAGTARPPVEAHIDSGPRRREDMVAAELAYCLRRFLAATADEPTMERARRALEAFERVSRNGAAAGERELDLRDAGSARGAAPGVVVLRHDGPRRTPARR